MDVEVKEQNGCLFIAGDLTIYNANIFKECVAPQVRDSSRDINVDLGGVTALDTSGLQVLLMLRKHAQAAGHAMHVRNSSEAAREVFELCGLRSWLDESVAGGHS